LANPAFLSNLELYKWPNCRTAELPN